MHPHRYRLRLAVNLIITLSLLASVTAAWAQQKAGSYSVAVLPFDVSGKEIEGMGEDLQTLLTAHLSSEPQLLLVERAEVDKALSEAELGMSGIVDPATAAQVGRITGAQILLTGRVFPVRKELAIVSKLVGVETGRVYGQTVSMPLRGSLVDASLELATMISDTIATRGETLAAPAAPKDDVLARLRQMVEGKELPSVSISIPEISLNRSVPDPAAETEIGYLLQKSGFEIVDPLASNKAPDIEVSGEAFSEFGLRKGNLVSSKGRVEIKAIARETGRVVLVDRETAVAVDLSPEVAGKQALAKSAVRLTERLVVAILENLSP